MSRCGEHPNAPDPTCDTCRVAAEVTQLAADGKVRFAAQILVEVYAEEIEQIRKALGFVEDWLVTDETALSDFHLTPEQLASLVGRLLVRIEPDDYLVDVAKRLREAA